MKERRKNIYKGIAKNVIIKTVRNTIITDVIIVILLQCFLKLITAEMAYSKEETIMFWKTSLIILLFSNLLLLWYFAFTRIDYEKEKINKKLVEDILPKEIYVKVFPKEGHLRYKYFFEKELPKIADYFAILHKNDKIEIVAIFNEYDKDLFIEYVRKENFINSYEVLETPETTEKNT